MGMAAKNGNLYIANGSLNRVYKVDSSDVLTVVAGNGSSNADGEAVQPLQQASSILEVWS